MSSKAVEKVEAGNVPALAPTPATEITFEDISPPTLYVAQRTSAAVSDGLVNYGDLFVAQGASDPEPTVMWSFDSGDPGVLFHPLHMYKTWTFSDGENLRSWPYGDGSLPADAPEGTFRTYNFVLFVPGYDEEMPVNFRLNSKSQRPAANKINYVTSRSGQPSYTSAFTVTARKNESGAHKWTTPVVLEAEAQPDAVAKARRLFEAIMPGLQQRARAAEAVTNQPSI